MIHVNMLSGGEGSWAAGKIVAQRHGTANLIHLFTDTRMEDEDTYRFLHESAENIGGELIKIADGRTIWKVFEDRGFLGNSRVDPCSQILKRELADAWLEEHCDPEDTRVYVGIDITEVHRYERMAPRKLPWVYRAPLVEEKMTKQDCRDWSKREGLETQRLYQLGMPHANCGGGCVKMGQGGFARLYYALPEVYAEWERNEERLRDQLGDVAILRDRTGGETAPLPLRELRERLDAGGQCDMFDIGGCGCFVDVPDNQDQEEAA